MQYSHVYTFTQTGLAAAKIQAVIGMCYRGTLLGNKRKSKSEGKGNMVHLEPTLGSCFLHLHETLRGAAFCGLSGRGGQGRSGRSRG